MMAKRYPGLDPAPLRELPSLYRHPDDIGQRKDADYYQRADDLHASIEKARDDLSRRYRAREVVDQICDGGGPDAVSLRVYIRYVCSQTREFWLDPCSPRSYLGYPISDGDTGGLRLLFRHVPDGRWWRKEVGQSVALLSDCESWLENFGLCHRGTFLVRDVPRADARKLLCTWGTEDGTHSTIRNDVKCSVYVDLAGIGAE